MYRRNPKTGLTLFQVKAFGLMSAQDVPTVPLALQPGLESLHRLDGSWVKFNPFLSRLPHASPFAREGEIAEQAGFDRQDIVPCHVAVRILPIKNEVLDSVLSHAQVSLKAPQPV